MDKKATVVKSKPSSWKVRYRALLERYDVVEGNRVKHAAWKLVEVTLLGLTQRQSYIVCSLGGWPGES